MNYADILPYIEKGLISEQRHPEDNDVAIFNYTQKCQFEREWDDITMNCRGLIMRVSTGEIIARGFKKFFNYQEAAARGDAMPSEVPVIAEKLDGSLGILYYLNGKAWIATRGSFMSDQAQWATEWWRKNVESDHRLPLEGKSLLFEIIYPANRIVVNYDFSGLVFLAALDTKTGKTLDFKWNHGAIRTAKLFDFLPTAKLIEMDEPNSEGFVLFYPNADLRLKVKFPEYVRLHKLVTGLSEIAIWENMREGNSLDDLLEKVPDEFFKWVKTVEMDLRIQQARLWGDAQFTRLMVAGMRTRKEQAQYIMQNCPDISGIVFSLLDGQDKRAMHQIFQKIRPKGRSSFKVDIDL